MKLLKAIWSATWKIAVFLTLWGVLYSPLLVPVANRLGQNAGSSLARLYFEITAAITILLAAWVMTRFIDKRSFVSLGFMRGNIVRDVVVGLGIGLGMMAVSVVVLWSFGWAVPHAVVAVSWFALFPTGVAMLANTVTQEVLVRGYIQQAIQAQSGSVLGVILSAVVFTLL